MNFLSEAPLPHAKVNSKISSHNEAPLNQYNPLINQNNSKKT